MKNTRFLVAACAVAAVALILPELAEASWWTPKLRDKQVQAGETEPAAPQQTGTQPAQADPTGAQAPAPTDAPATETAAPATPAPAAPPPAPPPPLPDSDLRKLSARMREGPIGQDPNALAYLDLVDSGRASAAQVNDFAAYVAKKGMIRIAIEYQEYATKLAPAEPVLWLNLGTMNRTIGSLGPAESAFKKTLAINPSHAMAHYNLGAVYDADGKYDEAIEEYRRALVLDPELADPRKNPQVVNNENLLAVKLTIYENQAGSMGLPLLQMQKPPAPAPAPSKSAPPEKQSAPPEKK